MDYVILKGFKSTRVVRLRSLRFVHCTMEVILDELQKNNVNIDVTILSQHINYMLGVHEDMYNEMANRLNSDELLNVFNEMNVNSFGRVVYQMNISEEDVIREAVRLVVPILRDTARVEGSFI